MSDQGDASESALKALSGRPTPSEAQRLARHLRRTQGMFSLAFVRWNHPGEEPDAAAKVRAECHGLRIKEIRLEENESHDPLPAVVARLPHGPAPDALFVYGMEKAFPDFLAYKEDDKPPVLTALNLQRDAFPKSLPLPVVLWLPDHGLGLIARGSPDFWSVRSGVFEFELPPELQVTVLRAGAEAASSEAPVPAREVERRVQELVALWTDLSSRGDITERDEETIAEAAEQVADLLGRLGKAAADKWADRAIEFFLRGRDGGRPRPDFLLRAGNLFAAKRSGSRAQNLGRAIELYQEVLASCDPAVVPVLWASVQVGLGNACARLLRGDPGQNVQKAIACFEAALKVYTQEEFPVQWAATQNSLGSAYFRLPTGDRGENLKNAIACYEAALTVRTREDFPVDWAMTQNNLGAAYSELPTGHRGENLKKAIGCCDAALKVWTREEFPVDWATTQNNLGNAYQSLPTGDRGDNLYKAIACYDAALQVRTREEYPAYWAITQNNLGNAYSDLPTGDRGDNLYRAIACYQAALQVHTESAFPHYHGIAGRNLARATAALKNL